MPEKRYCIICGKEILSKDPEVVFCPEHGGPKQNEPSVTQFQETTWEAREEGVHPVTDVTAVWQPGQTLLDTYKVVGKLGEGGMGLVYRVHHNSWNMDLAVKQPKASLFATQKGKEDFIREAETWVGLGLHPHITSCYYVRTINDIPHIFVEFMAGGSLEDWIQGKGHDLYEGGPEKSLERILDIAIQFAWGLSYAHECNLVHQDVKPLNVLMTPEGVVKVADFGLAKARAKAGESAGEKDRRALVSGSLHTVAYRSPEQAKGGMLSPKTDIWSWAVSVLEMFEGGVYWYDGQSASKSLESYLGSAGEEDLPNMPAGLVELLRECFQEDPGARPQDMLEIAKWLTEIYESKIGVPYSRQRPDPADLRADSLNNKALSMLEMNKRDDAVNNWQEALRIQPDHPEATYNLGLFRWQSAQITDHEFVQQLEAVVRTKPREWKGHYLLGKIHLYREDPLSAVKAFEQALEIAPHANQVVEAASRVNESNSLEYLSTLGRHENHVNDLAVSQDGHLAVSGGRDRTVRIWDLQNRKQQQVLEGHQDEVTCVAISPNGSLAVSGSASYEKMVKVWDLACGKQRHSLEDHSGFISDVAITPDGQQILSCSSVDNTLRLWDLDHGTCQQVFKELSSIECLAITPDGKTVVSGDENGDIRLWNFDTGVCQSVIHAHSNIIHLLRISPDGKWIISGSWEHPLKIWDIETGTCRRQLLGHKRKPSTLDITDDGHWCISIDDEKILHVWDLHTGICRRTVTLADHVYNVAYIPGRRFLISYHQDIQIWRFPHFKELKPEWEIVQPKTAEATAKTLSKKKEIIDHAKTFLAKGNYQTVGEIVTRGLTDPYLERDPDLVDILHLAGQKAGIRTTLRMVYPKFLLHGEIDFNHMIRFTPDNSKLVAAAGTELLHVWDLTSGECINQIWTSQQTTAMEIDPSGQSMVVGDEIGHVEKREVMTGKPIHEFESHGQVSNFEITPDGKYLVLSCEYGPMSVWNWNEGNCLLTLSDDKSFRNFALLPQKYHAVSLSYDNKLQVWDFLKGQCLRTIEVPKDTGFTLVISPDGSNAITKDSECVLRLLELASGKCLQVLAGHTGSIYVVDFLPDGSRLISGGEDNILRIWDLDSGKCVRQMRDQVESISRLVVSPDGKFAITFGMEKSLNLWDLSSGALLNRLEGHNDIIYALEMESSGRLVATGSGDETIMVWQLDWDYDFPEWTNWDEGARPYLETFLTLHTPYAGKLPQDREPTEEEIRLAFTRRGNPTWTEAEFQDLYRSLGPRGYGWLREEGVRRKLEELAAQGGSSG